MHPSNNNITPHEAKKACKVSFYIDPSVQDRTSGPFNRNAASKPSQPSQTDTSEVPIRHWVKTEVPAYAPPARPQTFQSADDYEQALRDGTLNPPKGPPLFTVRKWTARPSHLEPLQQKSYLGRMPDVRRRPDGTYCLADHMLKKGLGGERAGEAVAAGGDATAEPASPAAPTLKRKAPEPISQGAPGRGGNQRRKKMRR